MRRTRRRCEPTRAVSPAALLDALRRDLELGAGGDEDRTLEHTILLRADELLALVQKSSGADRVDDEQGLYGAGLVDLGDGQAVGAGLVQSDVLGGRRRGRVERNDGEPAERTSFAELEGQRGGCCGGLHDL